MSKIAQEIAEALARAERVRSGREKPRRLDVLSCTLRGHFWVSVGRSKSGMQRFCFLCARSEPPTAVRETPPAKAP